MNRPWKNISKRSIQYASCGSAATATLINHLKAWLLRVAINECRMTVRKTLRFVPLDNLRETSFPRSDDEGDLSWALMQLNGKYREVLYLYYEEGYKVREIAGILGTKEGTVSSLLKRGRDKLKKMIGGDDE